MRRLQLALIPILLIASGPPGASESRASEPVATSHSLTASSSATRLATLGASPEVDVPTRPELDELAVERIARVLSYERWDTAGRAAYAELCERLVALDTRSPRPGDGQEGLDYLALADIGLRLWERAERTRAEPALAVAERALQSTESAHGGTTRFAELLNRCARVRRSWGEVARAQQLLTDTRIERACAEGCVEIAWAMGSRASMDFDRAAYGRAAAGLHDALEQAQTRAWSDPIARSQFEAWANCQLVAIEAERGRVDWASAALAAQRSATRVVLEPRNSEGAEPPTPAEVRGRDLIAKQLLLSELRIDLARGDADSALYRAGPLAREPFEVSSSEGFGMRIDWALRLQVARALSFVDVERGRSALLTIAEAHGAQPIDRAFSWLTLGIDALDRGQVEEAMGLFERTQAGLDSSAFDVDHVLRARLEAAWARAALVGATASRPVTLADVGRARDALARFRAVWQNAGTEPDGVGFLQYDYRRELLVGAYFLAEAALGAADAAALLVEELAATQQLATLTRALGDRPFDIAEASALLGSREEGIVSFLPGRNRVLCVMLDGEGPAIFDLGPPLRVLTALSTLGHELARPTPGEAWCSASSAAGAALFPHPVRARVQRWRRVSFGQPELIGSPALEAVTIEGLGVLGLERALTSYPTLPAWLELERRAAARAPGVGAVALVEPLAVPASEGGLQARMVLTGTAPALTLDETSCVRLAGAEATLARFAAAARGRALGLLWTHGQGGLGPGRGAAFEVTDDSGAAGRFARASDVELAFRGTRAPQVIVLGICGAARPDPRPGEDAAVHLGGTFMALGADVVLSASRDLHALSARALLDHLLAELDDAGTFDEPGRVTEGARSPNAATSIADALLAARKHVAADPRWAHPHYWSALGAFGVAQRASR